MKNKILLTISVVLLTISIIGTVYYNILLSEIDTLNFKKAEINTNSNPTAAETHATTYEDSTINDVLHINHTEEQENEIKQLVSEYINIRYNYTGSMKENVSEVYDKLSKYVADGYMEQVKNSILAGAGNMGATDNRKNIDDYCTVDDIYYTSDTYDDGSELHMMICECHISKDISLYREVSVAMYEGKYKVNYDKYLTTITED